MSSESKDIVELKTHTRKEIFHQPEVWQEVYALCLEKEIEVRAFLKRFVAAGGSRIVFAGAGSSAFVGEALTGLYQRELGLVAQAIATTDIVSHPSDYFFSQERILLVSFARSGDSPESVAAYRYAEAFSGHVSHLIITCNKKGKLAQMALENEHAYVLCLPEVANDKSLAMTASFTSMLLAGVLVGTRDDWRQLEGQVNLLCTYSRQLLGQQLSKLEHIARLAFSRVVFLGAGSLQAIARESHLKVQELSNGNVICKYDSYLGFRHGPRAVLTEGTLIVYLLSSSAYSARYELDLIRQVQADHQNIHSLAVGECAPLCSLIDTEISFSDTTPLLKDPFFSILAVIPGQVIGYCKSLALGLNPDQPSKDGVITRVVQGVTIYSIK